MRSTPDRLFGLIHPRSDLVQNTDFYIYLDGVNVTKNCQCADDGLGFVVLGLAQNGKMVRSIRFGDVQMFACEKA